MPKADDKAKFQQFAELYGSSSKTNKIHRPSYVENLDESQKTLLVKEKVRAKIICICYSKPRVIYGDKKNWKEEEKEVLAHMEIIHYFCGSPLFEDEHRLHSTLVVRQMWKCDDPLEMSFFSSAMFCPACYYCGLDESLVNAPDELKSQYHTLLPLCSFCQSNKKKWFTRRPKPGVPVKKKKK